MTDGKYNDIYFDSDDDDEEKVARTPFHPPPLPQCLLSFLLYVEDGCLMSNAHTIAKVIATFQPPFLQKEGRDVKTNDELLYDPEKVGSAD